MDWKPFASTFALLFLAELGDKTQLACILQAAKFQKPWMVLAGAVLALATVTGIGVAVGHACGQLVPQELMRYVAGGLFIVLGTLMILKIV
jgi:putative Ca2+/H+ antiporter (TMEM165/GDT1 family)